MDDIWKEIAALQSQLAQTQKTDFGPRLSERNCIDLVQKLLRMQLIDLVYSSDGREYITPPRLQRDILQEVEAHGGRIALDQLAEQLNVDPDVVKRSAEQLIQKNSAETLRFVQHELISDTCLRRIAEQINEQLDIQGIITSANLSKQFNLPAQVADSMIFSKYLGTVIHAQRAMSDRSKLYTKDSVNRHRSIWFGMLAACTRHCSLQTLLQNNDCSADLDRGLSLQVIEELIAGNKLRGSLSSSRFETAWYTPAVLADARRSYVTKTLSSNGYIEYDRVKRQLDVADAKSFISKAAAAAAVDAGDTNNVIVFFHSCAVRSSLIQNVESYVQEALSAEGYADLAQSGLCPSCFTTEDYRELLNKCKVLTSTGGGSGDAASSSWLALSDEIIISQQFISKCTAALTLVVDKEVDILAGELAKMPEVRRIISSINNSDTVDNVAAAAGDAKTSSKKSGKAAAGKGAAAKSGSVVDNKIVTTTKSPSTLLKPFIDKNKFSDAEIENLLLQNNNAPQQQMPPREIIHQIVEQNIGPLIRQLFQTQLIDAVRVAVAAALAQNVAEENNNIADSNNDSGHGDTAGGKKVHHQNSVTSLRDQILNLMQRIKAFEKGAEVFASMGAGGVDTRDQLRKHLARTVGAELLSLILMYCESAELIKMPAIHKTTKNDAGTASGAGHYEKPEERRKAIDQLPVAGGIRQAFVEFNDAITKANYEQFDTKLGECLAKDELGLVLRKKDRKSERVLLAEYAYELKAQLEKLKSSSGSGDLAVVLHLVVLNLFTLVSKQCLHATGKFVPAIINEYLYDKLAVQDAEDAALLKSCLQLVIDQVKKQQQALPPPPDLVEKCFALVEKYEKKAQVN